MEKKELHSKIMAIANLKYGWDYDVFHSIMEEWGYGSSLRALDMFSLKQLRRQLLAIQDDSTQWELDGQGKFMWFLLCESGLTKQNLVVYMIKKYHKNNWNLLSKSEKRGSINMLKNYKEQRRTNEC